MIFKKRIVFDGKINDHNVWWFGLGWDLLDLVFVESFKQNFSKKILLNFKLKS